MEINVGKNDRILRLIIGLVLISVGIYSYTQTSFSAPLSILSSLIGVISVTTGAAGYCMLYSILGTDTCSEE